MNDTEYDNAMNPEELPLQPKQCINDMNRLMHEQAQAQLMQLMHESAQAACRRAQELKDKLGFRREPEPLSCFVCFPFLTTRDADMVLAVSKFHMKLIITAVASANW